MLSSKHLETLHYLCAKLRGNQLPFGGIQVICVGDFMQLPPVPSVRFNDPGSYAFNASFWDDTFHKTELVIIHRQKETQLVKVCCKIIL